MLSFFRSLNKILWGAPLLTLLLGTHLYFTLFLGFIQKKTLRGIRLSIAPSSASSMKRRSGFSSLATTLAATLGTGNIIGVSTAIYFGGAGALFWCWLTGILGMATTYAECYLSFLYRRYLPMDTKNIKNIKNTDNGSTKKTPSGRYVGGPMYVLEDGLHKKGLAIFYSFCIVLSSFGVGCTTQSNSIAAAAYELFHMPPVITGILAAFLTGLVIVGGSSSIERFCVRLVPFMGGLFLFSCFYILMLNIQWLPTALRAVFSTAFSPRAAASGLGGGLLAFSLKTAARYGIARGLFTNEAGIGTAGIAAAASQVEKADEQALISMTATFWDTVVICAVTGLAILTHLLRFPDALSASSAGTLTHAAFSQLSFIGAPLLNICLILFAFATLTGWSYFGQQAFHYLFPKKNPGIYQTLYLVVIFLGAVLSLELVWEISDTINFLLLLPNLFVLYRLKDKIRR